MTTGLLEIYFDEFISDKIICQRPSNVTSSASKQAKFIELF